MSDVGIFSPQKKRAAHTKIFHHLYSVINFFYLKSFFLHCNQLKQLKKAIDSSFYCR